VRIAKCKGMDGRTKRRPVGDQKRARTRGFAVYVCSPKQTGWPQLACQHRSSELFKVPDGSFHDSARQLAGSTFGQSSQCASPCLADFVGWVLGRQGF
jgi:hypothetical protein